MLDRAAEVVDQELHAADEKRYTGHDGVTEMGAEGNHDKPYAEFGDAAQKPLMLLGKVEVDQGRNYSDDDYQR